MQYHDLLNNLQKQKSCKTIIKNENKNHFDKNKQVTNTFLGLHLILQMELQSGFTPIKMVNYITITTAKNVCFITLE